MLDDRHDPKRALAQARLWGGVIEADALKGREPDVATAVNAGHWARLVIAHRELAAAKGRGGFTAGEWEALADACHVVYGDLVALGLGPRV